MTAIAPDTRCERCSGRGVITEWDDDTRKYVKRCQLCGRLQGSVPATVEETEKVNDTREAVQTNGRARPTITAAIAKPDSAAAKALESYSLATTRYLEASQKLQEAEQRRADADARVVSCLDMVTSTQVQMREARAKLDSELALLTPAGEPKPFRERVKVRAPSPPVAVLPERPCKMCDKNFLPSRANNYYCSKECGQEAQRRWHREHPNGQGSVVVKPSSPEAIETSLEAIPAEASA